MSTSKLVLVACSAILTLATTARAEDTVALDLKDRHNMQLQLNEPVSYQQRAVVGRASARTPYAGTPRTEDFIDRRTGF
jgi:hypothetical protein